MDDPRSPPWQRVNDSDIDDLPLALDFINLASTPLKVSKSAMLVLPMRKLDKLHILQNPNETLEDDFPGDQTLVTEYSSESELEPIAQDSNMSMLPVRKRKAETSDMVITPQYRLRHRVLSVRLIPVLASSVELLSKISFSNSDSTPCPAQPRKRFKRTDSPGRKGLLNLSQSTKAPAASVISKLNQANDEDVPDIPASTPLSQSTPANSRPPSPSRSRPESPKEDTDDSINGFSFVKPQHFSYRTPQSRPTSMYPSAHVLRTAYNANNYQVVGEFPVSAAGLMDEKDVHVGDKRINDPYLRAPEPASSPDSDIRLRYFASPDHLPLLADYTGSLSLSQAKSLLSTDTLLAFYKHIFSDTDGTLVALLKRDRLRWHPDKWLARINDSPFDMDLIHAVSQGINALIDSI